MYSSIERRIATENRGVHGNVTQNSSCSKFRDRERYQIQPTNSDINDNLCTEYYENGSQDAVDDFFKKNFAIFFRCASQQIK